MSKISQLGRLVSDNAPVILTAMGVTGLVGTAVLAVRATPEAMRRIEDAKKRLGGKLTNFEQVQVAWKPYIPAAISGSLAIACIVGAQSVNAKRNAAVIGLYSLSETAFKEYREKVADTVGEKRERDIRGEIAQDRMKANPPESNQIHITGLGEQLCYDSLTGRYFKSDIEKIRKAQNDINATCINEMYASQNDFYRLIGLPPVALGEEVGWRPDVMMDIQFDSWLSEDGQPALSIDYRLQPIRGYYKGF